MYIGIKRFLDILFSTLLLPILLPVILLFCILIILEDGKSPFYISKRLGKDGNVFSMLKLRSMVKNAEDIRNSDGSSYNALNDKRQTKTGKFIRKTSIDELPQIFNILIGDMSFVGPRPDLPDHIDYYVGNEIRKLTVLPGITGMNQAYFRNTVEWKSRIKNDLYYVENISFLLDLKIVLHTFITLLFQRGIYIKNTVKDGDKTDEQQT